MWIRNYLARLLCRRLIYARTYTGLARFGERALADIQVSRDEIEFVARKTARIVCR